MRKHEDMISILSRLFIMISLVLIFSCVSSAPSEVKILKEANNKADKYEKYLVNPEQYTTKGAEFHNKYFQQLIGIASLLIEEKKIAILEKSIGFYYDKREDKKEKLYLGMDISATIDSSMFYTSYNSFAIAQLRKFLGEILNILQSYKDIFDEKEIIGSVIGIKWEQNGSSEMVSIWINQSDVVRYMHKEITYDELIQRNFITNTEGKIIKLLE